ncbi:MAG: hypothetical protein IPF56_12020 [Chloroflexi bacterium]|nr:hypothetical protein [Chloroflexota bacterium]
MVKVAGLIRRRRGGVQHGNGPKPGKARSQAVSVICSSVSLMKVVGRLAPLPARLRSLDKVFAIDGDDHGQADCAASRGRCRFQAGDAGRGILSWRSYDEGNQIRRAAAGTGVDDGDNGVPGSSKSLAGMLAPHRWR